MSPAGQVFGRRHDEALPALDRPASEKRQGTKSRLWAAVARRALWGFGRGLGRAGDETRRRWDAGCSPMQWMI
jgi:hypothetical protein